MSHLFSFSHGADVSNNEISDMQRRIVEGESRKKRAYLEKVRR